MNRIAVLPVAAIVLSVLAILSMSNAQGREATPEHQFADAISAKGAEYVAIRERILTGKTESLPILRSKLNASDWRVRVVAEALISHIQDSVTYARYEERIMTLSGPRLQHTPPSFYDGASGSAFEPVPGYRNSDERAAVRSIYKEPSWVWFFAESALKGSLTMRPLRKFCLPDDDPQKLYAKDQIADLLQVSSGTVDLWMSSFIQVTEVRNGERQVSLEHLSRFVKDYLKPDLSTEYREMVRCADMLALSCFSDNPVVIPLLTELLQSRESTRIRGYAALALGASGNPEAIGPLSQAQDDSDSQVREAARESLSRLNGFIEEARQRESLKRK